MQGADSNMCDCLDFRSRRGVGIAWGPAFVTRIETARLLTPAFGYHFGLKEYLARWIPGVPRCGLNGGTD